MNPQSSSTNLPELLIEKDVALIAAFAEKQGAKPNEQMLKIAIESKTIEVHAAKLNGVILGMRVFQRVINPIRAQSGYALLEDWANGFTGLDPV